MRGRATTLRGSVRSLLTVTVCGILVGSGVAQASEEGGSSFPRVALVADSQPRYASLALDDTGEQTVFVLFDGNAEQGYNRAYLWVPRHARFGQPVAVSRDGEGQFPPFKWPPSGTARVETVWQLSSTIHVQSEGFHTHHDYATGRTVRSPRSASRSPQFGFSVRYSHAAGADSLATASAPLELVINGSLPTGNNWDSRPAPFTPWHQLYLVTSRDVVRGGDSPDMGTLQIQPRLVYHPHQRQAVRIQALPAGARFEVSLNPFRQPPLVTQEVPITQFLRDGFSADIPFGWYEYVIRFQGVAAGITVHPHSTRVFPVARM